MTAPDGWQPIATAPLDVELEPFLVLTPGNETCPKLILQVSPFEGNLYPDHLAYNVCWDDRVITATHWRPML